MRLGFREDVGTVFQSNPGDQCNTEGQIEQTLVGDCEDDEDWRKCQEDDHQPVEIMVVWLKSMQKWHNQRQYWWLSVSPWIILEKYIRKTFHPTIWFPRGRPNLACRDNALDLVTIMARMMKPICSRLADDLGLLSPFLTCTPMSERDKVLSAGTVESPGSFDFTKTFFSSTRYSIPTVTIKKPPDMLLILVSQNESVSGAIELTLE